MTKPVEVIDAALAEVAEAVDWYLQSDERVAQAFAEEYTRAIRSVGRYFSSFPPYLYGTKRHLFAKYPYQLVIRELPDRLQIVAVAHLRRKPGYWMRRLM